MTTERPARGNGTLARRAGRAIGAIAVVVLVSCLGAELAARWLFDLAPLTYRRVWQPLFVTGDYFEPMSREEMERSPEAPQASGYTPRGLIYGVDLEQAPTRTVTSLTDFVFNHPLSRYAADDIDRILCDDPVAPVLWVLGSSAAQGSSADGKLSTWHFLLEQELRRRLGKPNLHVFNGAVGGSVAVLDKLAFYLAVLPRRTGPVLFLNSYNDLVGQGSPSRPGDPHSLPAWYGNAFGSRPLFWLAGNSAIVNRLLQNASNREGRDRFARLNRDDALFDRHIGATIDTYMENMEEVLAICEAQRRPCWVALQPNRSISSDGARPDRLSPERMRRLDAMLHAAVARSPWRDRFIDLARVFVGKDADRYFSDTVHVTELGQSLIAEALAPRIAAGFDAPPSAGDRSDRCTRLPSLRLLARLPLDRLFPREDARLSPSEQGVALQAAKVPRWHYAAGARIDADSGWPPDLVVRVRLRMLDGDLAVVAVDRATNRQISRAPAFVPADGETTAELRLRGYPASFDVMFQKQLPDGASVGSVIREITVLSR